MSESVKNNKRVFTLKRLSRLFDIDTKELSHICRKLNIKPEGISDCNTKKYLLNNVQISKILFYKETATQRTNDVCCEPVILIREIYRDTYYMILESKINN